MLTRTQILEWMDEHHITRKQLAQELGVNYNALCSTLSGTRPISAGLNARLEQLMQQSRQLVYVVPPEWEPLLKTWAATAGVTPEEMLTRILQDAFKIER